MSLDFTPMTDPISVFVVLKPDGEARIVRYARYQLIVKTIHGGNLPREEVARLLAKAENCIKNTLQNFNPTGEVSSIQQSQPMKPKSIPSNKSDSQDLVRDQESTRWRVYTQTSRHFGYRVEYPSDWSVEENENVSFFMPPHATSKKESIAVVVINYKKTPPLPVHHTYTTIRAVAVEAEEIPVRKRQPSPVTEKYFAERKKGDYVAEFRFFLGRQYDAVFDRMLSTLTFIE